MVIRFLNCPPGPPEIYRLRILHSLVRAPYFAFRIPCARARSIATVTCGFACASLTAAEDGAELVAGGVCSPLACSSSSSSSSLTSVGVGVGDALTLLADEGLHQLVSLSTLILLAVRTYDQGRRSPTHAASARNDSPTTRRHVSATARPPIARQRQTAA